MYDHTLKLAHHQMRHQATHKVGYQLHDCIYGHFNLPQGFVWVCMGNILTLSPSGRRSSERFCTEYCYSPTERINRVNIYATLPRFLVYEELQ